MIQKQERYGHGNLFSIYSLDSATLVSIKDAIYIRSFSYWNQAYCPSTLSESSKLTPFFYSNESAELSSFFPESMKNSLYVCKKPRKLGRLVDSSMRHQPLSIFSHLDKLLKIEKHVPKIIGVLKPSSPLLTVPGTVTELNS